MRYPNEAHSPHIRTPEQKVRWSLIGKINRQFKRVHDGWNQKLVYRRGEFYIMDSFRNIQLEANVDADALYIKLIRQEHQEHQQLRMSALEKTK
jgi:hypothetical protein